MKKIFDVLDENIYIINVRVNFFQCESIKLTFAVNVTESPTLADVEPGSMVNLGGFTPAACCCAEVAAPTGTPFIT